MNHKTALPNKGYLQRNEVCAIESFEGIRYAKLESIEFVYDVSKLTTQKDFFVSTIFELIDSNFEGIEIGFSGDWENNDNFEKIKISVSV